MALENVSKYKAVREDKTSAEVNLYHNQAFDTMIQLKSYMASRKGKNVPESYLLFTFYLKDFDSVDHSS